MRTLMRWVARLYPAEWRARYAVEMEALLEDVGPGRRDLWDLLRGALFMQMTTLSFWKILAGCALAGVLVAGIWSATLRDRYVSTAVMRMSLMAPDPDWTAMRHMLEMQQAVLSRSSLASIIEQQNLYSNERKKLPIEDVILTMRNKDLRIQPANAAGEPAFAVEFANENPAAAQATVQAIVSSLIDQNLRAGSRWRDNVTIAVMDPASLPSQPAGPNRRRVIGNGLGAGLLLGLLCGAIWSVVRKKERLTFRRIGVFAGAGMTLGLTIAFLIPDVFVSTAVLRTADENTLRPTIERVLSDDSLAAIVRQDGVFPRQVSRGGMKEATHKLRESIQIQRIPQRMAGAGHAFVVSFTYTDRWKAHQVTRDLVARFTGIPQSATEVLDPASLPKTAGFPNRPQIALLGTFAGIVLGVAASHLRPITPAAMLGT